MLAVLPCFHLFESSFKKAKHPIAGAGNCCCYASLHTKQLWLLRLGRAKRIQCGFHSSKFGNRHLLPKGPMTTPIVLGLLLYLSGYVVLYSTQSDGQFYGANAPHFYIKHYIRRNRPRVGTKYSGSPALKFQQNKPQSLCWCGSIQRRPHICWPCRVFRLVIRANAAFG